MISLVLLCIFCAIHMRLVGENEHFPGKKLKIRQMKPYEGIAGGKYRRDYLSQQCQEIHRLRIILDNGDLLSDIKRF